MEQADDISGIDFDAYGDLWISTKGDGLHHWIGYGNWEGWTSDQGLPADPIWTVLPLQSGGALAGTDKGVARIDEPTGKVSPLLRDPLWSKSRVVAMQYNHDGSLFALSASGSILRIDERNGTARQTAKLPYFSFFSFKDSSGIRFFATVRGIWESDAELPHSATTGQKQRVGNAPFPVEAANNLIEASPLVYYGCEAGDHADWFLSRKRILRLQNGQWTVPELVGMPALQGTLMAIHCAPDGSIWIAGEQTGVWQLKNDLGQTTAKPLPLPTPFDSLELLAILVDSRGWVWLGTGAGLLVWNQHEWRHLTEESGMIWNDVDQGAIHEGPDGSIWVGTSGGVAHLRHPERVFESIPMTIFSTQIRRGAMDYFGAHQLTIPWAGAPLDFQFAAPVMRNRSELVIETRLDGFQTDWAATQDGRVSYPRLAPGSYTMLARVCNAGLGSCSSEERIAVVVLPPWWRSNWFFTLCGLAFLLILIALDRLRAHRLQLRSEHLERVVSERTCELEASRAQLSELATQLMRQAELLREQATHDGLTGLLNRVGILDQLEAEMERARREDRSMALLLADLDYFKKINDSYGHLSGDAALCCFAAALSAAARSYDRLGRYGGEEFLVILANMPEQSSAARIISFHQSVTGLAVAASGFQFTVNCSMGAVLYHGVSDTRSIEDLLRQADAALYAAKAAGRNQVQFAELSSADAATEEPAVHREPADPIL